MPDAVLERMTYDSISGLAGGLWSIDEASLRATEDDAADDDDELEEHMVACTLEDLVREELVRLGRFEQYPRKPFFALSYNAVEVRVKP
ncbi:MAG: hypothetical protein WCP77_23080 [Roseococcus sp.]